MTERDPIRWLCVANTEAVAIPPYALMRKVGLDAETGCILVGKPSANGQLNLLVNGPSPIPAVQADGYQVRGKGTADVPTIIRYSTDNDTGSAPAHGEEWGAKAGEWELHKGSNYTGYYIIGDGSKYVCEAELIGNPSTAICTTKNIVSVFDCASGTKRQQVELRRGCDILAAFCEDQPTTGGCCGSGGVVPISTCPCSGASPPKYWTLTFAGITNGTTCSYCAESLNRKFCLIDRDAIDGFAPSGCVYLHIDPNGCYTPCGYFDSLGVFQGVSLWLILQVSSDGSASLAILDNGPTPGAMANVTAVYYVASWNCSGTNTMSLLTNNDGCATWPATVTLTGETSPTGCDCTPPSHGGGGGGGSTRCTDCNMSSCNLTIASAANNDCTNCAHLNGTFPLLNAGDHCTFNGGTPAEDISCPPGVIGGVFFQLKDNLSTGWELTITYPGSSGATKYFLSYASWSCAGLNTMAKSFNGTSCIMPATVTILKTS